MSTSEQREGRAPDPAGLRVVAIGGGTGLSTLLKGLKRYVTPATVSESDRLISVAQLSAIVTVSDNGGSSGRLRKELNILPPGDIRNCIVALSEDEALMSRLFRHRFARGEGLEGHNFGNLFLAALCGLTGDFAEAVKLSSEILATRGHIYPATTSSVELEALRIAEALARSSATKIYVCNLMTQANESLGLSAADHIRALNQHARTDRIFDYALINRTPLSPELKAKYALEGAAQIFADLDDVSRLGVTPVLGEYLEEATVARHATVRVAQDLLRLVNERNALQSERNRMFE
ncbi:MAG: hypothetical protein DMG91_08780 [Acidobacteria bacterium]|nr:MAG: hypothetical protein DMG91_08780 [Acidobacteriota bacterium]